MSTTKSLEKLKFLLDLKGKSALAILENLGQKQKSQNEEMDAKIKKWQRQLLESIVYFLTNSLPLRHQAFLNVLVEYGANNEELLSHLVRTSLQVGINSEGQYYALIGQNLVYVKESELNSMEISFDYCKVLCSEINSEWNLKLGEKSVTIDCNDSQLNKSKLVQFTFDGRGLTHDQTQN